MGVMKLSELRKAIKKATDVFIRVRLYRKAFEGSDMGYEMLLIKISKRELLWNLSEVDHEGDDPEVYAEFDDSGPPDIGKSLYIGLDHSAIKFWP